MSKGDCMADCPPAITSGLLLHAPRQVSEETSASNNAESCSGDVERGRSNFLRMLRAFVWGRGT